jgi:hypothetical protein
MSTCEKNVKLQNVMFFEWALQKANKHEATELIITNQRAGVNLQLLSKL